MLAYILKGAMHDEPLPAEKGGHCPPVWTAQSIRLDGRLHIRVGSVCTLSREGWWRSNTSIELASTVYLERDPNLRNARQILDEHIRALSACDLSAIGEMEAFKLIPRAGQEHSGSTPERRLTALRIQVAEAYRVARKNFKDDLNNLELERRDQVKAAPAAEWPLVGQLQCRD